MRCKTILSAIAFTTAFVFSSVFASLFIDKSSTDYSFARFEAPHASCRHDAATKAAIETLLEQDIRNGRERLLRMNDVDYSSAESYYSRYAESVEEYAHDSGSMDYGHLPRDFQFKWRAHMRAWSDYSDFLNQTKDSDQRLEDTNFYREKGDYISEINSTWYEVLRTGDRYCARVSE